MGVNTRRIARALGSGKCRPVVREDGALQGREVVHVLEREVQMQRLIWSVRELADGAVDGNERLAGVSRRGRVANDGSDLDLDAQLGGIGIGKRGFAFVQLCRCRLREQQSDGVYILAGEHDVGYARSGRNTSYVAVSPSAETPPPRPSVAAFGAT